MSPKALMSLAVSYTLPNVAYRTANSRCSLTSVKWFHIDPALLAEYEQYARELFAAYR